MGLFGKVLNSMLKRETDSRPQRHIDYENQVREDGVDYASKRIMEMLNNEITSLELAKQFVLEELDAARQGNEYAQIFAKNSGFKSYEYVGALTRTRWKGDESKLEHIQLYVREAFFFPIRDVDLMVELSTAVVDKIMKKWALGKYTSKSKLDKNDIMEQLSLMSRNNTLKEHAIEIIPINEIWSWNFKFSEDELQKALKLIDILFEIRNGDFIINLTTIDSTINK